MMVATAARSGLLSCPACRQLHRPTSDHSACVRCAAPLHARKPASLSRAWAFLIAAMILYIPANLLPIMHTGSLFGSHSDTILSGVLYLWNDGSWFLAAIVFIASIVIPGAKMAALAWLLLSMRSDKLRRPREETRVYRVVDYIGRWSMVDIYVGAVLVSLVQFKTIADITAGPGAVCFGAVVVLTILAANAFDPRLIWDREQDELDEKAGVPA